ncbi:MAG: hypothetical protein HKO59_13470 [Phycisphaerales bacterium]|nr:hypothetical protein [Phycisphaerae bacterium]NNM26972.1 hypothetical protein [Phycisphaerales bacterium]
MFISARRSGTSALAVGMVGMVGMVAMVAGRVGGATRDQPFLSFPGTPAFAGFAGFESGFEPEEGCAIGYIGGGGSGEPQNCVWRASTSVPIGATMPVIADTLPATGSQHLHFEHDPVQASGSPDLAADPASRNWAFSESIVPAPPEGLFVLDLSVRIAEFGGPNAYIVQPEAPSQGMLATVMILNPDGTISVGDDANPDDDLFSIVNTGAVWTPGDYHAVRIELDAEAGRINYWYDDELVYSTDPAAGGLGVGVFAGTIIERILIRYEGNNPGGPSLDIDDVSIAMPPSCPWDVDGSGDVGFTDLVSVIGLWGPCDGCPEDIDQSGDVGFSDLVLVLSRWGVVCR